MVLDNLAVALEVDKVVVEEAISRHRPSDRRRQPSC